MPQRVGEGVEVRVQFSALGSFPVPDIIRERKFSVKAQSVPMAVWGPEMHARVRESMEKRAAEVSAKGDPAKLTEFGRKYAKFIQATGGRYEGGKAEVGNGTLSLIGLNFVHHGAQITAILPHPLETVTKPVETGVTKSPRQEVEGIWVTPAVWKKRVDDDRKSAAERLGGAVRPGSKPTRADLREKYYDLPPGDYYWFFFIPDWYNGSNVDLMAEMQSLAAVIEIEALHVIDNAEKLAKLPAVMAEAEGMRSHILELERNQEVLTAKLAAAAGAQHDTEVRLHEKEKPLHEPAPVAVKPLPGAVPWSPREQEEGAEAAKKRVRIPHLKGAAVAMLVVAGLYVAGYFGTLPAAQATEQTSLAAAAGAMISVFSGIAGLLLLRRRRGVPTPEEVAKAKGGA